MCYTIESMEMEQEEIAYTSPTDPINLDVEQRKELENLIDMLKKDIIVKTGNERSNPLEIERGRAERISA